MTDTMIPYNGLRAGYNQAKDAAASLFKPLSPEKQQEFEQTRSVLQQTLSALKNSKNDIAQQKKAMAQQKIMRIKEAIKSLKQTGFMDAKSVARMASRLARELAAAIKEYASAGATFTEISAQSGNNAVQTTEQNAEQNTAQNPEQDTAAEDMPNNTDATVTAQETDTVEHNPFQAYEKTQNFGSSDESKTIRKKDDDSEFIKTAKEILEELRNLVKAQRNKVGTKSLFGLAPSSDDEKIVRDAEKALQEADKAFASMTRSLS